MLTLGGSFGVTGVKLNSNGGISIAGRNYEKSDIVDISKEVIKDKKLSIASLLLGIFIIIPLLAWALSIFGLILGILITAAGSYYSKKKYLLHIYFNDDNNISIDVGKSLMKNFIKLVNNQP